MVTLEKTSVKNFFSVGSAEINWEDQGLVVVHGRVGSGKTALICESVLYGLYGTSFEYGQTPGQAVKKNTEKNFHVIHTLRSESGRFRIMRGKDPELKLSGLELYRVNDDGSEDRLTRGSIKDTQKLISDGLLKMSERLFKRSVVCSTDMGKFPDAPDSEKKSILDELLELWVLQGAHEETISSLKAIRLEAAQVEKSLEVAKIRLDNELKLEAEDPKTLRARIRELMTEADHMREDLASLESAYQSRESSLSDKIVAARRRCRELAVSQEIFDKIAQANASIRALNEKKSLSEKGNCPKCGQKTDDLCENFHEDLDELNQKLEDLREEKKAQEDDYNQAEDRVTELERKLQSTRRRYQTLRSEGETKLNGIDRQVATLSSDLKRAQEMEDRVMQLRVAVDREQQALQALKLKQETEEVLERLFSTKGCRLSIIRSVIPFLNEEADRVSGLLGVPIQVRFSVRGSDESFAGALTVDVHNPIGSWQYRGSSAGERRTIDIIILMCLMSLSNRRNNRFNHVFFDETFEKLDPPLQRAVLMLLKEISTTKSSVFLITHSAGEIKQEVDQTWEVSRGGVLSISKS